MAPAQTLFRPSPTYTLASNSKRRWSRRWGREDETGREDQIVIRQLLSLTQLSRFQNREEGSALLLWSAAVCRAGGKAHSNPLNKGPSSRSAKRSTQCDAPKSAEAPVPSPPSTAWDRGRDPQPGLEGGGGSALLAQSLTGELKIISQMYTSAPLNLLRESYTRAAAGRTDAGTAGAQDKEFPGNLSCTSCFSESPCTSTQNDQLQTRSLDLISGHLILSFSSCPNEHILVISSSRPPFLFFLGEVAVVGVSEFKERSSTSLERARN